MITIIIAAHNMEKYIEEALDSILAQTYKNYELILVDDGSTDETFNIMQTYQVNKFIINFKPGNPIPLGAGRKGSFFYKKIKKISYFFYSLLKNPAY